MTRIRKQLPVPECDGDDWYDRIRCAWDECMNPGSAMHTRVICHAAGVLRHDRQPRDLCPMCEKRAYCSAQHADYDARAHRPGQYGRLSPGTNTRYFTFS
jgi:hypothetical protein